MASLVLIIVAAWVEPAAQAAKKPLYKGTFKANLSGSYQVDWKMDRADAGTSSDGGPSDCEGSGTERVTFSTPGPLEVKLIMNRPTSPPLVVFTSTGDSTMHVATTLERTTNMVYNGGCPELQSCTASAQPEWLLELLSFKPYEGGGPTKLSLAAYKPRHVAEPLPQCPAPSDEDGERYAHSFPELSNSGDPDIAASLYGFKLFKPDVKRFKFSASGFDDNFFDGEGNRTALDFTLALKRTSK